MYDICVELQSNDFHQLINDKLLANNTKLPKKFYTSFCKWNFVGKSNELHMKQYILKKTGIFPTNYTLDAESLIYFMELLSLLNNPQLILPKDVMLTICGYLFI